MRTLKVRKLSYKEWLQRVDDFLFFTISRRALSFEGVIWVKLYDVGCSPGEVVEALVDELRKVEQEEAVNKHLVEANQE